jgi:hypothetical protein
VEIQLKQSEIEKALCQWMSAKGIDMAGKVILTTFRSGRKGAGVTATMIIEDPPSQLTSVTKTPSSVAPECSIDAAPSSSLFGGS